MTKQHRHAWSGLVVYADPVASPEMVDINDYTDIQKIVGGVFDVRRHEIRDTFYGDMELSIYVNDDGNYMKLPMNWKISMLLDYQIVGDVIIGAGVDNAGHQLDVHPALADAFLVAHDKTFGATAN